MTIESGVPEISQLVYISERGADTNDEVIKNLKLQAEHNNHRLNITGALLYTERFFLQFLEGEQRILNELFSTICQDDRHSNVRLMMYKTVQKRDFPTWSLGVRKLLDHQENQDLLSLLNMLGNSSQVSETQLDWFKMALK